MLRTHKLGEADRIITLLTRQHGRVRAVAKGVRKTTSRWGSRLEPFTHVDLQLAEGRNLDVVTQAETIDAVPGSRLGDHYDRYTAGTAMLETADRLVAEEKQPSLQQFLLLVGGLRAMTAGERAPAQVLDSYLLRSLAVAGYAPSFTHCARCGDPGPHRWFSPAAGGALCADCRVPGLGARRRPGTLEVLGALLAGDWPVVDAADQRSAPRGVRVWSRPTCTGTSSAACARWSTSSDESARDPPARAYARRTRTRPAPGRPTIPRDLVPAARRDHHGRQRPLGQGARAAPDRGPRAMGEAALFDVVEGAIEIGVKAISAYAFSTENWTRSPDEVRFLMGFNRDVIRRRRDEMHELGRAGALGRPRAAAVEVGDQGAPGRRGADPRTTTC